MPLSYQRYQQPPQGTNALDLNTLLNKDYCDAVGKDRIPCVKLYNQYRPVTDAEMRAIITAHAPQTIAQCADHAFTAQTQYNCFYSYAEITEFIDELMVKKTVQGVKKERAMLKALAQEFRDYTFEPATWAMDTRYAVDIIIKDAEGTIVAGVQVKPNSHRIGKFTDTVKSREDNLRRNGNFARHYGGAPVVYAYYDIELKFNNYPEVLAKLHDALADTFAQLENP